MEIRRSIVPLLNSGSCPEVAVGTVERRLAAVKRTLRVTASPSTMDFENLSQRHSRAQKAVVATPRRSLAGGELELHVIAAWPERGRIYPVSQAAAPQFLAILAGAQPARSRTPIHLVDDPTSPRRNRTGTCVYRSEGHRRGEVGSGAFERERHRKGALGITRQLPAPRAA